MTMKEFHEELLTIRDLAIEATSTAELAIIDYEYTKLKNIPEYEVYNRYDYINRITFTLDRMFLDFYKLLS